jgi:hypothetical protein
MHWAKGVGRCTTPERIVLFKAENYARERAYGEAYQELLDEHDALLVDAPGLSIRSVVVRWLRHNRLFWIRVSVFFHNPRWDRDFQWKCALHGSRKPRQ